MVTDMENTREGEAGVEAGAAVGKTVQEVIVPREISQLRTTINQLRTTINQLRTTISQLRTTISQLRTTISQLRTTPIIIVARPLHSQVNLNRDVETVGDAAVYSTRSYNALVIALVVA